MATTSSPSSIRPRVRQATLADKDGFVNAIIQGYEVDHQFRWRYPKRHEFPEDAKKATGDVFEKYQDKENMTYLVAELPSIENEEEWVVVAACMWEWKYWEDVKSLAGQSGFSSPTSGRRDMDPIRQQVFIDCINEAEKRNFGAEWGPKRLELATMACDRKYHRRGAGKALMEYGMQMAKEQNTPITLTASPLGRLMYKRFGFQDLDLVECGVDGVEERVSTWVMAWTPKGWEKYPHEEA